MPKFSTKAVDNFVYINAWPMNNFGRKQLIKF